MRSREMSEEATVSICYYITTLLRTKMKIPRDPNGAESSLNTWQAQRMKTQQDRQDPSIQDERNLARWLGRREQPLCMVSLRRHSLAGGHLGLLSGVTGILGIKATCQQCRMGREEAQAPHVPGKSQITCSAGQEVGGRTKWQGRQQGEPSGKMSRVRVEKGAQARAPSKEAGRRCLGEACRCGSEPANSGPESLTAAPLGVENGNASAVLQVQGGEGYYSLYSLFR